MVLNNRSGNTNMPFAKILEPPFDDVGLIVPITVRKVERLQTMQSSPRWLSSSDFLRSLRKRRGPRAGSIA